MSREHASLIAVFLFAVIIKSYDPIRSPVVGALDPWSWVAWARQFLATGELNQVFYRWGYPPTFVYLVAGITSLGPDAYDVVRYIPIASSLIIIPVYLLTLDVFGSRTVAALSALLTATTRYHFMRTSIGIPETPCHFFLIFALFFIMRSLKTGKWTYRTAAAAFMTIAILFYHFTLEILVPFIVAVPFMAKADGRSDCARVLGSIVIPSALVAGGMWYFRVVGQMIAAYFGTGIRTYQVPTFERSLIGFFGVLVYSTGKTGLVALSHLGYMMTALGLLGFVYIMFSRAKQNKRLETSFLVTYLLVLVFLTIFLRILYTLGLAGAGDSSVYVFSWLTMPVAAFTSYGIMIALETAWKSIQGAFKVSLGRRSIRTITVVMVLAVCLINLSAVNYYRAWDGNGIGILRSHYYYKCMTDQEYNALVYLRDNAPTDSAVLTVGEDVFILTYQAIVSRRTMISITDMRITEGSIIADLLIVHPDQSIPYRVAGAKIAFWGKGTGIYFIEGIRKVNLNVAAEDGPPPPSKTLMENVFMKQILTSAEYGYVFRNDQVAVLYLPYAVIEVANLD